VAQQRSSGQTVRGFCREQKLSEHSFYWWRGQLRSSAEEPIRFALVETATTIAETHRPLQTQLELVLNSGERLQIPADAATLRLVLSIVREQGQADR
jgi:Transposase